MGVEWIGRMRERERGEKRERQGEQINRQVWSG